MISAYLQYISAYLLELGKELEKLVALGSAQVLLTDQKDIDGSALQLPALGQELDIFLHVVQEEREVTYKNNKDTKRKRTKSDTQSLLVTSHVEVAGLELERVAEYCLGGDPVELGGVERADRSTGTA